MATAAQQMFAIAPAFGTANLTGEQKQLLVGKARWIFAVREAGLPVVPTICITREAWETLKAEHDEGGTRLRAIWVATLFKLVGEDGVPPHLVVRTSAAQYAQGLMHARINIPAPKKPEDANDLARRLPQAIEQAFASYSEIGPVWTSTREQVRQGQQIVIIQAMVPGPFKTFATRNLQTGALGPAPTPGTPLSALPENAALIAQAVDRAAGRHMSCLVAQQGDEVALISARALSASADADLEAAVDRVELGFWSPRQAVTGMDVKRLPQLLHPRLAANPSTKPLAMGVGVSPGAASGKIVFTADDAIRLRARGQHCILVATETGPGDIDGMQAATGILTARGGQNSHAAIIARVSGKACVAGMRALHINPVDMTCRIGDTELHAGQNITVDGTDGAVYEGSLHLSQPHIGGAIAKLLNWSDGSRTIAVRTNVETVESAQTALSFGAEGIGLARSEHMFFSPERLVALRRLILSESEKDRLLALKGLVDYQSGDYAALFELMVGKPVTVRLFDPPLHEFLPRSEEDIEETAASLGLESRALRQRLERLAEVNPMLGHRGCRLAITYPEVLEMQIHALFAGGRAAMQRTGEGVDLEIMVPFVTSSREVGWLRNAIEEIARKARNETEPEINYAFGTMIELPRAALRAGDIAPLVDFFSFGTNDLTQTTYGISRDDAPGFLASYKRRGIYDEDPFSSIDQRGVGELIKLAIERGRAANPHLKIGICGEHAGDPASVKFFAGLGIDYVSCSPYRVPVARLALAQAQQNN